jgi:hypothetical protein
MKLLELSILKNLLEREKQIETEAAAEPEGDGEDDQYNSFVPKSGKNIKEDIKLKNDLSSIMKSVLEPQN